jgi:hypothetical protein
MEIMNGKKLLYKYLNGNVTVSIFEDGTKIQEWDTIAKPIYPNSIDIKITNKCDLGCAYCHEESHKKGQHGNLVTLITLLEDLPEGTELAIGGGNPLEHPDLLPFLQRLKKLKLIPNLTVNYYHIKQYYKFLNFLIAEKLIYGLGISIDDSVEQSVLNLINDRSNVVYHVIAGVTTMQVLLRVKGKFLILGYKEVGRGKAFLSEEVKMLKLLWYNNIGKFIKKIHLSFDNLAVEQLDIKRFLSKKEWETFYMGTDGEFTMYIDAVKQKYALSSSSKDKHYINNSIKEIFDYVRSIYIN